MTENKKAAEGATSTAQKENQTCSDNSPPREKNQIFSAINLFFNNPK